MSSPGCSARPCPWLRRRRRAVHPHHHRRIRAPLPRPISRRVSLPSRRTLCLIHTRQPNRRPLSRTISLSTRRGPDSPRRRSNPLRHPQGRANTHGCSEVRPRLRLRLRCNRRRRRLRRNHSTGEGPADRLVRAPVTPTSTGSLAGRRLLRRPRRTSRLRRSHCRLRHRRSPVPANSRGSFRRRRLRPRSRLRRRVRSRHPRLRCRLEVRGRLAIACCSSPSSAWWCSRSSSSRCFSSRPDRARGPVADRPVLPRRPGWATMARPSIG